MKEERNVEVSLVLESGVPLRFWLKIGKEKRRPARKTDYQQGFNKSV